ncbi:MAG: ATP-binding protein [Candidatus Zipacnadales bacterium]
MDPVAENRTPTWRISVPSRMQGLRELRARLREKLRPFGLAETILHDIVLATHEALLNAMQHGHGLDPQRYVELEVIVQATRVTIRVADSGQGFDWKQWVRRAHAGGIAPDALAGRGIMVMLAVMDKVTFNPAGNVVTMTKYVRPSSKAPDCS